MAKVHIRKKALTKGRHSIFLDFSPPLRNPKTGKPQRYEFLDIFLYDKPSNPLERRHNSETSELVENIRATRMLDIQNRKYGFISDCDRSSSFVDFFRAFICTKTHSECDNNAMSFRYFLAFAGHDLIFNDLDEFLCEDYKNFMLSGPGISRRGRAICRNTAANYFAKFRNAIKRAYNTLVTAELHQNNMPAYHLLALVEILAVYAFYSKLIYSRIYKRGLILLVIFHIGNTLFIQNIREFNSLAWTCDMLFIILTGMLYFFKIYKNDEDYTPLEKRPDFVITVGWLLYAAGSLFTYLMGSEILTGYAEGFFKNGWFFQTVSNIMKDVILGYGFWLIRKK